MRRMSLICLVAVVSASLAACASNPREPARVDYRSFGSGSSSATTSSPSSPRRASMNCGSGYTVRTNDTLSEIAERCGVSMADLASTNGLSAPYTLRVGQTISMPRPPVHVVQRGENLYRIGLRYGVPFQQLANHNGIRAPYEIEVGQQINLPAGTRIASTTSGGYFRTLLPPPSSPPRHPTCGDGSCHDPADMCCFFPGHSKDFLVSRAVTALSVTGVFTERPLLVCFLKKWRVLVLCSSVPSCVRGCGSCFVVVVQFCMDSGDVRCLTLWWCCEPRSRKAPGRSYCYGWLCWRVQACALPWVVCRGSVSSVVSLCDGPDVDAMGKTNRVLLLCLRMDTTLRPCVYQVWVGTGEGRTERWRWRGRGEREELGLHHLDIDSHWRRRRESSQTANWSPVGG